MGDVDAGNVKAKASIEYDGSGLKQMKEDLASLSDTLGGGLEQNTQRASDALSGLGESMSGSAGGAKEFSAALEELPKIAEGGTSAVAEMSGVMQEHRAAAEEAGAAQETFSKQVETATSSLEKAAPAMQTVSERTRGLNENLSQAQQSFSDLSAAIAEPGATESYTNLWKSVSGQSLGASPLGNFEVFQKAYNAIDPSGMYDAAGGMQMIDEHLDKTGQSYEQFAGSLSGKNQQLLHEMSMDWSQMGVTMDGAGQTFQKVGETAQTGFSTVTSSAGDADQAVAEFLGKTNNAMGSAGESTGQWVKTANGFMAQLGDVMEGPAYTKPVSLGGAFSEVMGGVGNMLNEIAMPLMATQMIGMAVQQVGQAMYDSAAIAEGPAAHSFGTFTGTVDALGQSLQKASGQFSEGFGQELLPTLNALNDQASGGDLAGLGHFVGGIGATLANLSLITTGVDPLGGMHGLINQGAALLGLQQPFQGPPPVSQYQQQMAALPQTVHQNAQQTQYQANLTMAEAINPEFLAAQQQSQAAQSIYQRMQQSYDISHPINQSQMIANAKYDAYAAQQEQNYQYQMNNQPSFWDNLGSTFSDWFHGSSSSPTNPNITRSSAQNYGSNYYGQTGYGGESGGTGGGGGGGIDWGGIGHNISGFFGGIGQGFSDAWNWLTNPSPNPAPPPQTFTGGCFVAGTPVLLADGREKPIEALQVGEQVLAYDGTQHVTTTVLATIKPLAKRVYKLTFADGRVLTLTNAHPLQGMDGWKSLSPDATRLENPDLEVTPLVVGDTIKTVNGTCKLTSILPLQGVRQIYNITVAEPHVFYAGGVLVHNKAASSIGSMANDGTGSQQVQVSHTFVANVQWEANNLAKQFTGAASWVGQNLSNMFTGAASWIGSGLSNTFNGVASWFGSGLSNTFNGVASWFGSGLSNTFQGIASWFGSGLSNTFHGAADWVGTGLENTFKGIASWVGQGLEHTFTAQANWNAQNLNPSFTVNPSVTMLAEGTSNWGGGPAIVGEAGPEVVESNGRYSMFDAGASLVNLPPGSNVYPMKNLAGSSVAQFANGTGDNVIPITFGVKSGNNNAPESINVYLQIDGQTFWSATGMSLAQSVYAGSGNRSY